MRIPRTATMSIVIAVVSGSLASLAKANVLHATPANYRALLRTLKPGDTLSLQPGTYPRLNIAGLNGAAEQWITITGPASGRPAIVAGSDGNNTIEITGSSYVAIENLTIDSRGVAGAFGIAAHGREESRTHDIRIEGNLFIRQNGSQQTVAISTKTPTWGWVIRGNIIDGAGTGIYLGDSDGGQPFVAGLIENNVIQNTIGYNLQIKYQTDLPNIEGMPLGPTSTIIRNNVFRKNDQSSPDGDRPNVLLGGFPIGGPGSLNMYEVYGNYFIHNSREALFQASGRVTLHDNVFVDGPYTYPTVLFRSHDSPLRLAYVYNNTIYTNKQGIYFGSRAAIDDAVVGNLIFAVTPVSGQIRRESGNIVDYPFNAAKYVAAASTDALTMNFFPRPGKCQGPPLDLSIFHTDTDYAFDFNGTVKALDKGAVVYRGAYAGEGANPGFGFLDGRKPPRPPRPDSALAAVWLSPAVVRPGAKTNVSIAGANFTPGSTVAVHGGGVAVGRVTVASATELTAILTIDPTASGARTLTVRTSETTSNPLRFRIERAGTAVR
jgi:hypothetical protein